ncbi:hypothetical protein ANN_19426 [Periplaneta americana]|uniref:DUF4817 domain-containing protein n=1 Tax=Periplaneta americana TaxID=6978 RepID=A0ABQ8SAI0_PERAM|nr:hypothetical protein ANN_19426 [Periplaneta americana]
MEPLSCPALSLEKMEFKFSAKTEQILKPKSLSEDDDDNKRMKRYGPLGINGKNQRLYGGKRGKTCKSQRVSQSKQASLVYRSSTRVCVRNCASIRRPEFECSGPQLEGPEFEYSELSLKVKPYICICINSVLLSSGNPLFKLANGNSSHCGTYPLHLRHDVFLILCHCTSHYYATDQATSFSFITPRPKTLSLPSKETLRGHSDSSFRGEGYIQCYVGVRLCDMYSNQELAEIQFMYGKADGNAALARRLYQERYPQRQCPDGKTFVRLHYRLCVYGKFNSPGLERGRPRSTTPEVQEEILEAVNMTPSISTRRVQFSLYMCASIIGDRLVGPHVLVNRLTGQAYTNFLENTIPHVLEDIPLINRQHIHFLHDGAPAHFSPTARRYLDRRFPDRWIGSKSRAVYYVTRSYQTPHACLAIDVTNVRFCDIRSTAYRYKKEMDNESDDGQFSENEILSVLRNHNSKLNLSNINNREWAAKIICATFSGPELGSFHFLRHESDGDANGHVRIPFQRKSSFSSKYYCCKEANGGLLNIDSSSN